MAELSRAACRRPFRGSRRRRRDWGAIWRARQAHLRPARSRRPHPLATDRMDALQLCGAALPNRQIDGRTPLDAAWRAYAHPAGLKSRRPHWTGFSGQVLNEGPDPAVNEVMIKAYNDWHVDEWCASYPDRFIPCGILPLFDVDKAAGEVRRLAGKGCHAVTFSENPAALHMPSIHSGALGSPLRRLLRRGHSPVPACRLVLQGGGDLRRCTCLGRDGAVVGDVDLLARRPVVG